MRNILVYATLKLPFIGIVMATWGISAELEIVVELGNLVLRKNLVSQKYEILTKLNGKMFIKFQPKSFVLHRT